MFRYLSAHDHCWSYDRALRKMLPSRKEKITAIAVVTAENNSGSNERNRNIQSRGHDTFLVEWLQFKQISLWEGSSKADEDSTVVVIVCWDDERKQSWMPHHTVGPFKQVSGGSMGLSAIHPDNEGWSEEDSSGDIRSRKTKRPTPHTLQRQGSIKNLAYTRTTA